MAFRRRTRPTEAAQAAPESIASRRRAVKTARAERRDPKSAAELIVRLTPLEAESPLGNIIKKASYSYQANREGHHLHVSDLLSKCIRKRCIHELTGTTPAPRRLTLSDSLTFAQGDAIHDLLKARARDGDPGAVWGKWSCKCESLFHEEPCTFSEIDQEEVCPSCNTKVDKYQEVSMFDDELWIVGNPDLLLLLHDLGAFHITELKSIAVEQYKQLTRPKPEHVLQVVFYWYLMNKLGYRLTNKVSIFYASKGWSFKQTDTWMEFVIDVQAELPRLNDMIADATAYKKAMQAIAAAREVKIKTKQPDPVLPVRSFCSSPGTAAAKKCEVCALCFELP